MSDIVEVNEALYFKRGKLKVNPLTKGECVTMSDGRNLEDVIKQIEVQLGINLIQEVEPMALCEEHPIVEEVVEEPKSKKRGRKKKTEVAQELASAKTNLQTTQNKVGTLETKTQQLEGNIPTMQTKVDTIETKVQQVEQGLQNKPNVRIVD